jgi:negative regulator of flagellin synthesis FlgM
MKISCNQVGRMMATELRAMEKARPSGQAAARPDQVSLSRRGAEIGAAHRALQEAPRVREEKVAELRRQVEQGSYHVPSEQLAADILRDLALGKQTG